MVEFEQALAAAGPIVGTASGDDGAVTVEVELGGRLRAVRLTQHALRYGAGFLADTVLAVAAMATARANRRAHQVYAQVLGVRGEEYLDLMGLSYDPARLGDEASEREPQPRVRTRSQPAEYEDDPADYPETWMRRR